MKGFSYIELMIVMALIVVTAIGGSFALFRFTKTQEPESAMRSIIATLRDAQQRSIVQQDGMYWGVRFVYDVSGRDSYVLFKSSDASGNNTTNTSIVYMRNNMQFSDPAQFSEPAGELKIIFDKMTGGWISSGCPSGTAHAAITVNGISTRVYCNGKIE